MRAMECLVLQRHTFQQTYTYINYGHRFLSGFWLPPLSRKTNKKRTGEFHNIELTWDFGSRSSKTRHRTTDSHRTRSSKPLSTGSPSPRAPKSKTSKLEKLTTTQNQQIHNRAPAIRAKREKTRTNYPCWLTRIFALQV